MKLRTHTHRISMLLAFMISFLSVQTMFAQDALTSVKFTVKNLRLSPDKKVMSYDVYLKDVDNEYVIAVPAFTFRLMVPQADLGENEKTVTVTNGTAELGADYVTMTAVGSNWLMKFNQRSIALSYPTSLVLSNVGDGTLVGTFNIANKDESSFSDNQPFNAIYSGSSLKTKSTVAILKPNTIQLAANSTTALPESSTVVQRTRLQTTDLKNDKVSNISIFPNPTANGFNINVGETPCTLSIFNVNGEKLMTQPVSGTTYVDISTFADGVYLVEANGIRTKLIKSN